MKFRCFEVVRLDACGMIDTIDLYTSSAHWGWANSPVAQTSRGGGVG
jgi:hypothetical protein